MKIKKKNERGQSLVELAISLVVLLFLLSGVVEFGIAFFQFIQLRDAAQEGALYGSIHPADTSGIIARVQGASDRPIQLSTLTPDITITGNACAGNAITVSISFDHQVFMPFVNVITGSTIPLTGSVTDTILQPACP